MEAPSTIPRLWVTFLLFALCILLGVGLIYQQSTVLKERERYLGTIKHLSNALHDACVVSNEQKLVNLTLERDLSSVTEDANRYSNNVVKLSTDLAQARLATPVAHPTEPERPAAGDALSEPTGLADQLNDLTAAMTKLEAEMADTQRKLQDSEGDRGVLLEKLKRLEAEKAQLMRQFTDLAQVREQLHKLKAEQAVSRRLAWIRRGLFSNSKGAELLQKGLANAAPGASYDLDVQMHRTGGAAATLPSR